MLPPTLAKNKCLLLHQSSPEGFSQVPTTPIEPSTENIRSIYLTAPREVKTAGTASENKTAQESFSASINDQIATAK